VLSDRQRAEAARVFSDHGYDGTIRLAREWGADECVFLLSAEALAKVPQRAVTMALVDVLRRKVLIANDTPPWSDGATIVRLTDDD